MAPHVLSFSYVIEPICGPHLDGWFPKAQGPGSLHPRYHLPLDYNLLLSLQCLRVRFLPSFCYFLPKRFFFFFFFCRFVLKKALCTSPLVRAVIQFAYKQIKGAIKILVCFCPVKPVKYGLGYLASVMLNESIILSLEIKTQYSRSKNKWLSKCARRRQESNR